MVMRRLRKEKAPEWPLGITSEAKSRRKKDRYFVSRLSERLFLSPIEKLGRNQNDAGEVLLVSITTNTYAGAIEMGEGVLRGGLKGLRRKHAFAILLCPIFVPSGDLVRSARAVAENVASAGLAGF